MSPDASRFSTRTPAFATALADLRVGTLVLHHSAAPGVEHRVGEAI
jgi:hypothetical protein